MGKLGRKGANTRERIIQAAAKLIIEKGVADTSLGDIADDVGISKGTLYYYYGSKGDLIFDLSDRHVRRITSTISESLQRTAGIQSPAEVIEMMLQIILRSETRGQIHVYLIQEALTGHHSSLRDRFVSEYRRWRELIEDGLRMFMDGSTDFALLSRVILYTVDGLLLQSLLGVERLPLDEVSRFFVK
jgi:AcrR family transcriptional regulator